MKRLLVVSLLTIGCSAKAQPTPTALAVARSAFGANLGRGTALQPKAGRFLGGAAVRSSLPGSADGAVHVAHASLPNAWIEQRALDVKPRAPKVVDAALVFEDTGDGVDLVMTVDDRRFEELRVISRREGLRPLRWSLELGPGLRELRLRDGRVEALEADGTVRLRTEPIVAVDASGRAVRLSIDLASKGAGFELAITPDPAAELPVTVDPAWTATTALLSSRGFFGFADLGGGKAMIVGGSGNPTGEVRGQSTAEIWDPKTSTWSATASMTTPRVLPIVARLLDGRVLVVGGGAQGLSGWPLNGCNQSVEIYEPKTDTWSKAADTSVPRAMGAAMVLTSGKVLIFGGTSCGGELLSTEIYDPIADKWSPGPPMNQPRLTATNWAPVGVDRFVVVGSTAPLGRIDFFDGKKFVEVGSIAADGREYPDTVVPLGSGRALIANGLYFDAGVPKGSTSAEVFDASTLKTTKAADADGRWSSAAVPLPGGKAMVLGGAQAAGTAASTTIYDPSTDAWTPTTSTLSGPRREVYALATSGGQILVAGSQFGTKDVDLYDACSTGFYADGVCCDKACLGPCERCDLPGKIGTCSPMAAGPARAYRTCGDLTCNGTGACLTTCSKDEECVAGRFCDGGSCKPVLAKGSVCTGKNQCATGFCVDGVCCDSACDGQCEACNLTGIEGTCGPVSGEVHGARTPCEGATDECGKICDGKDRKACVFRGTDTACGSDGCLANLARKKGVCRDGKCDGETRECAPYRCGAAGCPTACADATECVQGFACVDKQCVPTPKETRCSDDRRSVLEWDGRVKQSCSDFLCDGGACLTACRTSSDCFPGLVCDIDAKRCVVPTATPADEGGCAIGSPTRPIGAFGVAMLALAALARRRRLSSSRTCRSGTSSPRLRGERRPSRR